MSIGRYLSEPPSCSIVNRNSGLKRPMSLLSSASEIPSPSMSALGMQLRVASPGCAGTHIFAGIVLIVGQELGLHDATLLTNALYAARCAAHQAATFAWSGTHAGALECPPGCCTVGIFGGKPSVGTAHPPAAAASAVSCFSCCAAWSQVNESTSGGFWARSANG